MLDNPPPHQLGLLRRNLPRPLREHLPQPRRHARHVGLAMPVHELVPLNPETLGQLGSKGGTVDPRHRELLLHQEPSIERQPPARPILHPVPHHGMRVQLRIQRPRRVLPELGNGEALGVDLEHAVRPSPRQRPVPLQPAQRRVDRRLVRRHRLRPHPLVIGQRPEQRHRLRRRERRVIPPSRLLPERTSELVPRLGVPTVEHPPERLRIDLVADLEPDRVEPAPPPPPRRLDRVRAIRPRPHHRVRQVRLGQIPNDRPDPAAHRGMQHRDPHHRRPPPDDNATVCPSSSLW